MSGNNYELNLPLNKNVIMMSKENPNKIEKKESETDKPANKKISSHKTMVILIITLFLILSIAVSFSMILISSSKSDPNEYYRNYQDSDEYTETTLQAVLQSTIPKVTYEDENGVVTSYIGYSVERLIIVDSNIRIEAASALNISSLEEGLEKQVQMALESAFNYRQEYVLLVEYMNQTDSNNNNQDNDNILILSNINYEIDIENLKDKSDFMTQLITFEHTKSETEPFELILKFNYI